jgi:hypothetical protein
VNDATINDVWHVVCYSGGHSSALVAIEVHRKFGRDRLILLNHDINGRVEEQDIKRFKLEVAQHVGVQIEYANHPMVTEWDQFDVCRDARGFKWQTHSQVNCSRLLKTEPFTRWLRERFPNKNCIIYYGFDVNERSRIQRRVGILGQMGYRSDYPLALWSRTIQSTREIGIEPPLSYGTFKHANCVGCIKAGRQHWYCVFCTRPDMFAKAMQTEDVLGHSIISGIYLDELVPLFQEMRAAGVVPTEHLHSQTFWASARRAVKLHKQSLVECENADVRDGRPCECSF